ncbi:MAG TPA: AAA family ATPase [Streptosporangiaceae bacterium]|jgi:DNA-binding CsgD family transcriptional regulator
MRDQLVGRGEQLTRVRAALEAGTGQLVFAGEAGAGKTALLRETAALAEEHGFQVAWAQAHHTERAFPYGVVRQLFESLLLAQDEARLQELTAGAAAAAARLLFPDEDGTENDAADESGVVQALHELTVRLAEIRPLVLAVDDMQWIDSESLEWMSGLVGRSDHESVLTIATYTLGTGPAEPAELVGRFPSVSLPGLGERDIAALAREAFGVAPDPSFIRACHRATNGNVLLVAELVKAMAAGGATERLPDLMPPRITRWVRSRLGHVSRNALVLAQAVVTLGERPEVPFVAELTGVDADETDAIVRALVRMGFLTGTERLGFAHAAVRAAVDQLIEPGARRIDHARAATILHDADAPAEQVAVHLLATDPLEQRWAAETLHTAAANALGRGEAPAAIDRLRRALREPVDSGLRAELLAELGHAELRRAPSGAAGRPGAAVEYLTEAYEAVREPRLLARAAEDLATAHYHDGEYDQAAKVLDETVARLRAEHPGLADGLDALALAMAASGPAGPADGRTSPSDGRPSPSDGRAGPSDADRLGRLRAKAMHDKDLAITVAAVRARQLTMAGGADEAVLLAQGVVEAGPPDTMRRLLDQYTAAGVLSYADQLGSAARCAADMIAQAGGTGLPGLAVLGHALAAQIAFAEGRLDDAIEEARTASGIQRDRGGRAQPVARSWELTALLIKGNEEAAVAILTQAGLPGLPGLPGGPTRAAAGTATGGGAPGEGPSATDLGARGLLRELHGDLGPALADHLESGRRLTAAGMVNPALAPWRSRAALLACRLGRRDEALRLASEELGLARRWGTPRAIGVALRALGVAAGGPDGLSLLEESVSLLARSPARVEHAYALYDLGRVLGESGRREDARPLLHESYRLAGDCGAEPLAELCATEIRRVGGRRPRARLAGPAALTVQERRIAERAVAGATNREIAEELFLTLRTVEAHLTGVYRKLGIEGRAQLASRLAD